MPNIKSAKKRVKVNVAAAQEAYKLAVKKVDVAASKGIIHKNAAARKKSQFTKAVNSMQG